MVGSTGGASGLFKFVSNPSKRPQLTDLQAATAWGVAAGTTALWLVQGYVMGSVDSFVFWMVLFVGEMGLDGSERTRCRVLIGDGNEQMI
ncbi:hypothetical protein AKJ16_DCAP04627 [Drosera capensis]